MRITSEELEHLMKTNSWWQEISVGLDRSFMLHQLKDVIADTEKAKVVDVLFEYTCITEEKLLEAQSDDLFVEARDIIRDINSGEPFPERLTELYQSQKSKSFNVINQAALRLIPLISDIDSRNEVERLWNAERSTLSSLDLNSLPSNLKKIRGSKQRYILRSIVDLAELDDDFKNYRDYPFSTDVYIPAEVKRAEDENISIALTQSDDRIELLAYRVYDPLWSVDMKHFEPEYIDFPLKWAGSMFSVSEINKLFVKHKSGEDVITHFLPLYKGNEDKLIRLKTAISACPVTASFGDLFGEVVESFNDGRYKVSSTSLLSLIEGLLWEFAWSWSVFHGGLFDRSITHSQYKDGSDFELLKADGTRLGGRPNIGDLLRKTAFGENIYVETVEYLTEDLFGERNPVLHGRNPEYGNDVKAAALLFVVEVIERQITGALKEQLGKELIKHLPSESS